MIEQTLRHWIEGHEGQWFLKECFSQHPSQPCLLIPLILEFLILRISVLFYGFYYYLYGILTFQNFFWSNLSSNSDFQLTLSHS